MPLIALGIYRRWSNSPPKDQVVLGEDERLLRSSIAWLQVAGLWPFPRSGFLYLTSMRLVWIPDTSRNRVDRQQILLSEIAGLRFGEGINRLQLIVSTAGTDYAFFFVLYFAALLTDGDPKGHQAWMTAITNALHP